MPYFLYKIAMHSGDKVLEYVAEHTKFVDAKTSVRTLRAEMPATANYTIRMILASDRGEAEMLLLEKREAPILKEWEK